MNITDVEPSDDLISFIENNDDITELHFSLGAACYDEWGRWVLLGEAVQLLIYTDEENWGFHILVNTDIFVPFFWVRDERTEEMARRNAPKLKRLVDELIHSLPVTRVDFGEFPVYIKEYLERI